MNNKAMLSYDVYIHTNLFDFQVVWPLNYVTDICVIFYVVGNRMGLFFEKTGANVSGHNCRMTCIIAVALQLNLMYKIIMII